MPYNYYNPYQRNFYKRAAQPPMDPAMMGGAPPMDPNMMGGMPMDPSMMGGAPPMDPSMMMPPPPMDPAAMGAPPIDPAAAGLPPAAPPQAPPADPAAAEPAADAGTKKNPKQQLNDDISDIKNAIYNMQMIEAAIVKFLNIPIPVEALVRPNGGPDITNPVPEMVNLGGDEKKQDAPPSPEGELAKEGSLGRLLRPERGVSALLSAPPRLKNLLGY